MATADSYARELSHCELTTAHSVGRVFGEGAGAPPQAALAAGATILLGSVSRIAPPNRLRKPHERFVGALRDIPDSVDGLQEWLGLVQRTASELGAAVERAGAQFEPAVGPPPYDLPVRTPSDVHRELKRALDAQGFAGTEEFLALLFVPEEGAYRWNPELSTRPNPP